MEGYAAVVFEGLRERIDEVRERIARSTAKAGRRAEEIQLIAVTKVFPVEAILEGYEAGLRDFGENYVQEFEGKAPHVGGIVGGTAGARFHLIGHLQSNKSKKAAELFQAIHTVDSAKLARRLNEAGVPLDVYVEVKLSHEETKAGAGPAEIPSVVEAVRESANLRLLGLMTVPPWSEDAEASRPYFAKLREMAEGFGLRGLSMGMSGDMETAIEEGATCVRVGTALFGRRKKV
jgi:pyridoxal phosphate enzyme (YggS family)